MAFWDTHAAPSAFAGGEALIIINLQNDSLFNNGDVYITKNVDFVPRLKALVPKFRKLGPVFWIRTEFGPPSSNGSPDAARTEEQMRINEAKNREQQSQHEQLIEDDTRRRGRGEEVLSSKPQAGSPKGLQTYHPSSRSKEMMMRASAKARSEQRTANMTVFDDQSNVWEEKLSKPRKGGKVPKFYVTGTRGVELADEIREIVDEDRDHDVVKNFYSAFDQTGLLTTLRTNLITTIYLAGCLTNVGVYATAADAVQHGINVVLVEDCLGYRSEDKHVEAIRQMADIMGADGVDSEELIAKAAGNMPPDDEDEIFSGPGRDGIMMGDLSLNTPEQKKATLPVKAEEKLVPINTQIDPWQRTRVKSEQSSPLEAKAMGKLPSNDLDPNRKGPDSMTKGVASTKIRDVAKGPAARPMGPSDAIGSGDSKIMIDVLDLEAANAAFDKLKKEVKWQNMHHRSGAVPRLVANQGEEHASGGIPIYRHPADEMPRFLPFSLTVQKIRKRLEKTLQQRFNHVLIQLYRDGNDNISEHSDKTLDIARGSCIVNMSLGAQRIMTLRTKKPKRASALDTSSRSTQKIAMPHNSAFILGLETNREWLHGVRPDKRPESQKTEEELAFRGERISLTFRNIATFADEKSKKIWGQGARAKTKSKAGRIRTNDSTEMEAMVIGFGRENHDTKFDWDAEYGTGFDAINLVEAKAKVTLSGDIVTNQRVQLALTEKEILYTEVETKATPAVLTVNEHRNAPYAHSLSNVQSIVFEDVDEDATRVDGDLSILFYLERVYPFVQPEGVSARQVHRVSALEFKRTTQSNELLTHWRNSGINVRKDEDSVPLRKVPSEDRPPTPNSTEFYKGIEMWEEYAGEAELIAANFWTIIDCAFWPVLHEIQRTWPAFSEENYPNLWKYHQIVGDRPSVKVIIAAEAKKLQEAEQAALERGEQTQDLEG